MKVSIGLTAACDLAQFHSAAELVRIFLTCLSHFGKSYWLIAMRILAIHSDKWKGQLAGQSHQKSSSLALLRNASSGASAAWKLDSKRVAAAQKMCCHPLAGLSISGRCTDARLFF